MGERLAGKVALVTGAGGGIGGAVSKGLADEGSSVVCVDYLKEQVEATAQSITAKGGQSMACPADLTQYEDVEQVMQQTDDAYGGLDIIFINHGVLVPPDPLEKCSPADWRKSIDVNLNAAFYCAKLAIPLMKKRGGGKIITTGSGTGHRVMSGTSAAYGVSKAGLYIMTRYLASELIMDGITVNEMIPGLVISPMTKDLLQHQGSGDVPEIDIEWAKQPEDVVPLALFLATMPPKGPTGQTYSLMRREL